MAIKCGRLHRLPAWLPCGINPKRKIRRLFRVSNDLWMRWETMSIRLCFLLTRYQKTTRRVSAAAMSNFTARFHRFEKSTWSYNENHSNAVMSSVCDGKSNVITDGTSVSSSKSRGSDTGFSLNLGIEKGHTENFEKSHQKESLSEKARGASRRNFWGRKSCRRGKEN